MEEKLAIWTPLDTSLRVSELAGLTKDKSNSRIKVDVSRGGEPMQVETKFLRLGQPVALGEQIEGWRVLRNPEIRPLPFEDFEPIMNE